MSLLKKTVVLIFTTVLSFGFISQTFRVIARSEVTKQSPNVFRNKIASSLPQASPCNDVCTFYKWFDPNTTDKEGKLLLKNCSSCHMAYYNEWKDDKHSMSQNNPFFLSVYKQFKEDHPDQNGNCALCHNPEAVVEGGKDVALQRLNLGVDLQKRNAKKTNGVSCDFCHKIESIDQDPLNKGVAGLNIKRTCKGMKDIRFGPIKDPIQIERISESTNQQLGEHEVLKYNSLYKTSLACAKCHDGSNGNVQIYSTFTEWTNSPAAKKGVQCQSCHMKPGRDTSMEHLSIVDNPNIKQKIRPYYQVHSHSFLTNNPHEFRKKYVDLMIAVETLRDNILTVKVKVSNNNYGHSFPTGSPMRNAILVLDVKDKDGNVLKQIKGPKLPIYTGELENKPGKLFAKILAETSGEYATQHGEKGILFRKIASKLGIPAQDWWNVFITQDTRIKAGKEDVSVYEFDIEDVIARKPEGLTKQSPNVSRKEIASSGSRPPRNDVTVKAKLIWRNTWSGLAKLRGQVLKEDILIEKTITLTE